MKGLGLNGRQNVLSYGRGFLKKHMTWYDTINIVNGDHKNPSNKPKVVNLKEEAAKKFKLWFILIYDDIWFWTRDGAAFLEPCHQNH